MKSNKTPKKVLVELNNNGEWFELSEEYIAFLESLNNFKELVAIGGDNDE